MRKVLILAAMSAALLSPQPSEADVQSTQIQIQQKNVGLTIQIHGVEAVDGEVEIHSDRLYIPLTNASVRQRLKLSGDQTVSSVEIVTGRRPRLVVRIRHSREKTKAIGLATKVQAIDGGIVLQIPRWPISDMPLEAAVTTPIAKPSVAPVAPVPTAPAVPQITAAAEVEPEVANKSQPISVAGKKTGSEISLKDESKVVAGKDSGSNNTGLILGFLLLVAGAGVLTWKSRQKGQDDSDYENMSIVATKHLGGKSKIVWLRVASREMVIAVGDSGTQLLSEWSRNELPIGSPDIPIAPTLLDMPRAAIPAEKLALGRGSRPIAAVDPMIVAPTILPQSPPETFAAIAPVMQPRVVSTPQPVAIPRPDAVQGVSPRVEKSKAPLGPASGPMSGYRFQSALNSAQSKHVETKAKRKVARASTSPKNESESVERAENNPALAGLMKLRKQAPSVSEDVATQDEVADAEWARELLRATRDSVLQGVG